MKGKTLRRLLVVLLALVFLGSAGMLVYTQFQYREGDSAYAEAEELVERLRPTAPVSCIVGTVLEKKDWSVEIV